ncbi:MAG TPA: GDSL-type esterase/lipase family protein [Kofleriaceae bacterium]|jgi:lysophospholipase L1-like esterase|nr:GDSL-type esterase/lipase family protein [Kofleriaceae bacterium]
MSASDRSWTIAPVLLWFCGLLVVALCVLDGGVDAIADRFRPHRAPEPAAPAGPAFTAPPVEVAEAPEAALPSSPPAPGAPAPAPRAAGGVHIDVDNPPGTIVAADRSRILALEDTCLDPPPPISTDQCKRWALDAFFHATREAKRGRLGRALRVSWYGDSVIATDAVPAVLRTRFQDELGNGGPGFVYVVPPHRFCGHEAITRASGGSWNVHAITTGLIPDGLYGVGGSTAETDDGRATIKLVAGTASQLDLYYLAQPRGGSVAITADGKKLATVDTRGTAKQPGFATASAEGGAQKFELAAHGKVRLFGVSLENPTGVVVDNLGVISVNLKSFDANKPEHFQAELKHRGADLVMLMIGANEAEWLSPGDRDTKDYATRYAKLLTQVRTALPDASCLVVSPTDQAEARDGTYESRPVMPALINAQRLAAEGAGCAFYSTYDWMGGKGSAAKWFRKGMVGSDFQHLSRKGAEALGDGLFRTLVAGYQKYASH